MASEWPEVARWNSLEKSIDTIYSRAGAASGLSDSTFDILYALTLYGDGCSQRELCDRCWIGKQTVHSALGRLVGQGLIRVEPGEGRATRVLLTEGGRCVVDQKVRPIVQAEARALASLSSEELDALEGLLMRYHDALATECDAIGGDACR